MIFPSQWKWFADLRNKYFLFHNPFKGHLELCDASLWIKENENKKKISND